MVFRVNGESPQCFQPHPHLHRHLKVTPTCDDGVVLLAPLHHPPPSLPPSLLPPSLLPPSLLPPSLPPSLPPPHILIDLVLSQIRSSQLAVSWQAIEDCTLPVIYVVQVKTPGTDYQQVCVLHCVHLCCLILKLHTVLLSPPRHTHTHTTPSCSSFFIAC